jgi:eukaryotic-like serine/threonine-protein kinase
MLDPQTSRFWRSTLLSGLMDAEGLSACWEAITPAKRDALEHIDRRLARQAVQANALTLWQAQQLLAGRTSGFKVDRYVLMDLIGQGGMGRVYLARDTRLNRRVALKILSPERVSNPRAIARFQREARVGAQLQHENLVRIYDFGESNDRHYLVMEYIEGKTIGTLISEQGPIAPVTVVRLVRQVALGLEHAHRKGLIHRDVNPFNILVTRDGTAKLADLGLAMDLAEDDHVTREGATVGTFDYVAPEQARHSHSADIRSDIYSLGCTFYHMCSGQVPFPSPSLPEKLFAHQAMEPTPLGELVAGLPEGLVEVVHRMMRKSPEDRYATPMQVVQALEPYANEPFVMVTHDDGSSTVPKLVADLSAAPQWSSDAKVMVSRQDGAKPVLAAAVTAPDGLESPAVAPTESASGPKRDQPPAPPLGSVGNTEPSEADFPLLVDLGPEPALREGLSRNKPRSTTDHLPSVAYAVASLSWPGLFWLRGLVVLTAIVAILTVILAMPGPLSCIRSASPHVAPKLEPSPSAPRVKPKLPIVVCTGDDNEQEFPAEKILEAMQTAIGRGWIELRNQEPLQLTDDQIFDFSSGRGGLRIRAAPGIQPVISIELRGSKPLLTTGSGVMLELSGLTIVVRYREPPKAPASLPAPIVTAAGNAKIDRCAFIVSGVARPKGSCALTSNGGKLDVDRCWFQGFDYALEVAAMNGAPARIQQTIIVSVPGTIPARAPLADWHGWGVKLELGAGSGAVLKNPQPHLILDHCTIEGAGLIDLTSSPAHSPLQVEVMHCAIRTESLLACKHDTPPSTQVQWRGEGNIYDIRGHSWIVHSATEEAPALATGSVTDLETWLSFAPNEHEPIGAKLKFRTDPATRSEPLQPRDFTIEASASSQAKPGADPNQVGPWSNR